MSYLTAEKQTAATTATNGNKIGHRNTSSSQKSRTIRNYPPPTPLHAHSTIISIRSDYACDYVYVVSQTLHSLDLMVTGMRIYTRYFIFRE